MLKLFAPKKKKKSTLEMVHQSKIDKDIPPTLSVAAPPPPPIEPSPVLFMPKPKHAVAPTKEVLSQSYENDKTELELSEEEEEEEKAATAEDVSPIMLPHRVRFTSSSSSSHGTSPPPLPLNKAPTGSPTVVNKRTSIATSSDDSHRVYESALQSPISSPLQVAQQQQQQQQQPQPLHLPNNSSCTSLEDVEVLQRQVQYIQQLCEKERQEWMKREHAHRLREKEMLEKITETQDQLRQALEQVQQQQQQQQQQQHFHPHPSRDDSGYIEYEDDEPDDIDDVMGYHYYHRHHPQVPRARSMERPGSRQHGNRRGTRRRSVSVEKPRAIPPDEYRMPRRSRSRASSYYEEEDERDAYFLGDDAVDDGFDDNEEQVEDWDYYQPGTTPKSRAAPRPRMSESTPAAVRYLRPRRSYRRPPVQYHPAYYHHYYPYDLQ
ncbi:hypothetical protein BDB00DRAFT_820409 [Zychaea mexicana]|uniref:uncharacterized protein n=1 Tax=Zychaea mexicana TaxID=64656 RepID=UPI0022FEF64C|nr:uncharacterized protein BDB00DRAFT_820409 [Zychaea mexicana]KAI9494010.1 hypothetical protein BDB00DRAFT_820409 [Zychaea mexicana]